VSFPCLKRLSPLNLHHRPMEHITYRLILPHRFCFSVERLFITVFTAFVNAFLLQGGGLSQELRLQNPPPNGCRFGVRWSNAHYQGLCFPSAVFVKCVWVVKKKLIFQVEYSLVLGLGCEILYHSFFFFYIL
jgi:hypothetical protein